MTKAKYLPNHIAIIMDGNGRWAKRRGLPRLAGHRTGADNIRRVVKIFADYSIQYVTLYMFSTENWSRPKVEVTGLLRLLAERIDSETQAFHEDNIKLLHIGRLDRLSSELREKVIAAVELTRNNTGLILCLALDYGSRGEIVEAARRIISDGVSPMDINETMFNQYLHSNGVPDPDLIIRTGGEMRLSNFLLWQAAYSELHFTPVLWPDFGHREIEEALSVYRRCQRRFGST